MSGPIVGRFRSIDSHSTVKQSFTNKHFSVGCAFDSTWFFDYDKASAAMA